MAPCVPCGLAAAVTRGAHPPWHPVDQTGYCDKPKPRITGLRILNTLTGEKELFVPREGNRVDWYMCGPTVYDSAHIGHARAYLTMDIVRRVLEDYFNYDVFLQVNVTDLDDKIIMRARRNKLVADYAAAAPSIETVRADVAAAVGAMDAAMRSKLAKLETPIEAGGREEEERLDLLEAHKTKLANFETSKAAIAAEEAKVAGGGGSAAALIDAASAPLAEKLDAERGASITDHQVFEAHARRYEREYMEDMEALGIRAPDALTRVTEYMPQIVAFIQTIVGRGFAYESNGSVYMDIAAFKAAGFAYPKLEPSKGKATEAEMEESEGAHKAAAGEKRSKSDFALWKASRAGEPSWDSPWGGGRPGWHIECSVMASDLLGPNMDIHSGGVDLKFPHHDNELCQSEAFHGCSQWVNYFLHFGHLHIKGLKMSKSLKNFITIRQALAVHTPRQIRITFLLQSWDKAMDYSDQKIEEARAKEATFANFFGVVKEVMRSDWLGARTAPGEKEAELRDSLRAHQERVHEYLSDNINTAGAMGELVAIASEGFAYLHAAARPDALLLKKCALYVTRMLRVFGVMGPDEFGFPIGDGGGGDYEKTVSPFVEATARFRDDVRSLARGADLSAGAMLSLCDELRDKVLVDLGVRVEDRADAAALWKLDDPETLRKEVAAKEAAKAEGAAEKALNKLKLRIAELAKMEAASVPPAEVLKRLPHAAKYSAFDEDGRPTADAEGKPLEKKALKDVEKVLTKHGKEHDKYTAALSKNPRLIDEIVGDIAAKRAGLAAILAEGGALLSEETVDRLREAQSA